MDSLRYCSLLVKQIIKATVGVELSDSEAEIHGKELEAQLREEYKEAGSPLGVSEQAFLGYIRGRVNTELEVIID